MVTAKKTTAAQIPARCGENGMPEFDAAQVGDARLALFFALVRDLPDERLEELFERCIQESSSQMSANETANHLVDLFVIAFQTRDCRGGKGERSLFYKMLLELGRRYPATVQSLMRLLPEYGYYKDCLAFIEYLEESQVKDEVTVSLQNAALDVMVEQLKRDRAEWKKNPSNPTLSMCAKYAPREGKEFHRKCKPWFNALLERLFPKAQKDRLKTVYRQVISALTRSLNVPEVDMCDRNFSAIDFAKVPSVCAKRNRKAFLNEHLRKPLKPSEFETGNRYPDDYDRVECRKKLKGAVKEGVVKGGQLFPHEIVRSIINRRHFSKLESDLFNTQWVSLRETVCQRLQSAASDGRGINLGKLVPLVDVSGSMSGIPMEVAIALGILVSEVNHPSFRNRFITFETSPQWVSFSPGMNIDEKVNVAKNAPWGGSTNIEKAFKLIADAIVKHKIPAEDVPDLIIFSDMQFDAAVGAAGKHTQLTNIQRLFSDIGRKVSGTPYPAPRIIFWNLRGDTKGFPAAAGDSGVQMLSGYSPSLFKFLVEGVTEETTDKVDPYSTMRKVLDDERYRSVRQIVQSEAEGILQYYIMTSEVAMES